MVVHFRLDDTGQVVDILAGTAPVPAGSILALTGPISSLTGTLATL